jgi:hypothetical protein
VPTSKISATYFLHFYLCLHLLENANDFKIFPAYRAARGRGGVEGGEAKAEAEGQELDEYQHDSSC